MTPFQSEKTIMVIPIATDKKTLDQTLAEIDMMFSELKRIEDNLYNLRALISTIDKRDSTEINIKVD